MKIFFFGRYNVSERLSGPEKVAKRLFENVLQKEPNSIFIEYFFEGKKYKLSQKLFGKEITLYKETLIIRFGLIRLLFFLIKERPDVIHLITFERFSFIAFIYKMLKDVKIIYTVHGIIQFEDSELKTDLTRTYKIKNKFFERIIFKYSDKIVFLTNISMNFSKNFFNVLKGKVSVIPNGVDEAFNKVVKSTKYSLNDRLRIIFVGDCSRKEKGMDFLIKSLAEITIPVELFIVGENTDHFDKIENTNLHLQFVEKKEQAEFIEFLKDKDVIISASFYENFSISVAEAMSAGVIPVVTKETGISELIKNGKNGFVYNYGDSNELLHILYMINNKEAQLKELIDETKKIYQQICWQKISAEYINIYESLLR